MKTYLVGGAVRDLRLGLDPKDLDYVVVGATPQDMLDLGLKQVGADFPVFLDDKGVEFALARTERKSGKGYNGFTVEYAPSVTLKDDLRRRDLTVNAMAMDENGNVVDPFGGLYDLEANVLRHVDDEGFVEDPVRVLRWARFVARYNWKTAPETVDLMRDMVNNGLLDELTPERVFAEMEKAMMETHPDMYFRSLMNVGALEVVFPELHALKSATESLKWHPEGDAFEHTMLVLKQAVLQGGGFKERMAALVHDLGKGLTPKEDLPKHYGHDVNGAKLVSKLGPKYRFPAMLTKQLSLVTRFHMNMHRLDVLNSKTYVKMFDEMAAKHTDETVMLLYNLGKYDARGRLGSETEDLSSKDKLLKALEAYKSVRAVDVLPQDKTVSGQRAQQLMYMAHRKAVDQALNKER